MVQTVVGVAGEAQVMEGEEDRGTQEEVLVGMAQEEEEEVLIGMDLEVLTEMVLEEVDLKGMEEEVLVGIQPEVVDLTEMAHVGVLSGMAVVLTEMVLEEVDLIEMDHHEVALIGMVHEEVGLTGMFLEEVLTEMLHGEVLLIQLCQQGGLVLTGMVQVTELIKYRQEEVIMILNEDLQEATQMVQWVGLD